MSLYPKKLKEFGKVKINESLAKHTSFKIGGSVKYFVIVEDINNLIHLLQYLDGGEVPYMIIGGGSNMLAGDQGFDGVVIQVRCRNYSIDGKTIIVDAGMKTVELAHISIKAGLSGFEWGIGIPGTIGGAVRGNAGAMGGEMSNCVSLVEAYIDGEVVKMNNQDLEFHYRHSYFKDNNGVILRVHLSLTQAEEETNIQSRMKKVIEYLKYRSSTQPQGFSSTGCIFKNANYTDVVDKLAKHFDMDSELIKNFSKVGKVSAGWLVEMSGMKGVRVGDAEVSETHGNFIINKGSATSAQVYSLLEQVRNKVYDTYDILLEEEISIW